MKFPHIEFLGTDQEVLDFVGAKKFDYETDYSNASVNVRLFGSHGKCNVPLGYHLVKDSDDALSVLTDEVYSCLTNLETENAELKRLRCCENCKNVSLQLHWKESKEIDERRQFVCGTCGNRKHWEYLGKTVGITETQQLTKATELLKWALHSDPEHDDLIDFDTKWKEAEQFIKEIEK